MISIVMASYNGEKFIREQIDSILSQTIQQFELIICDDFSTDSTWEILKQYSAQDSRIKIFQNENNLGFKKNFEKAIGLAKGDYISLSDQDDVWKPDHLAKQMSHIGDKMIACGDSLLVDSENKSLNMILSYQQSLDYIPENDFKKAYTIFYFRNTFRGAEMMIKREFFDVALPIPKDVPYHDVWFAELSCFYGGMNFFKEPISHYRQHGNSVTGIRCKRLSKIRAWLINILREEHLKDRWKAAPHIFDRVDNLTKEQCHFLKQVIYYYNRKKTFVGRIINSLFELIHYKYIYSCSGKKWL